MDRSAESVRLRWESVERLVIEREISVRDRMVRVDSTVRNEGRKPACYLLVEHLILGAPLLGAATRVDVSGAGLVGLADEGHVLRDARGPWPEITREGTLEDWSARSAMPSSRFGALHGVAGRSIEVHADAAELGIRLAWSETFPFLWFWEERNGYRTEPWNGRTVCLGLEPASTSTGEGLAAAITRGEGPGLAPGAEAGYWVELALTA